MAPLTKMIGHMIVMEGNVHTIFCRRKEENVKHFKTSVLGGLRNQGIV